MVICAICSICGAKAYGNHNFILNLRTLILVTVTHHRYAMRKNGCNFLCSAAAFLEHIMKISNALLVCTD
jgi:hypothetical protein